MTLSPLTFLLQLQMAGIRRTVGLFLVMLLASALVAFSLAVGGSFVVTSRNHIRSSGDAAVGILLSEGARSESESALDQDLIDEASSALKTFDHSCIVSPESVVASVDDNGAFVIVRGRTNDPSQGLSAAVFTPLRSRTRGGVGEAWLGRTLAARQASGSPETYSLAGVSWPVAGVFGSGQDLKDSELWVDAAALKSRYGIVSAANSIRFRCSRPNWKGLRGALSHLSQGKLSLQSERSYYQAQSGDTEQLEADLALLCAGLLLMSCACGIGAITFIIRERQAGEQATLAVLGFERRHLGTAVLIRDMTISTLGALMGVAVAAVALPALHFSLNVGADELVFSGTAELVPFLAAPLILAAVTALVGLIFAPRRITVF